MIRQTIEDILNIAYKHISVNTVGYVKQLDLNDQHNEKSFQFIITDDGLLEKQIVEGIVTLKLSGAIIAFQDTSTPTIALQDEATHIFFDVVEFINNDNGYHYEVRDYALNSISQYTDNNCSGVYFTIQLILPSIVNLCEYQDHFIDKPIEPKEELILNNGDECTEEKFPQKSSVLRLNPLRL